MHMLTCYIHHSLLCTVNFFQVHLSATCTLFPLNLIMCNKGGKYQTDFPDGPDRHCSTYHHTN
jgi:hypothetical protein